MKKNNKTSSRALQVKHVVKYPFVKAVFPSFLCTCSTHKCIHLFVHLSFKWQYPSEEDMIEWAKRESEREEEQRLARLNQQEQEDLELATALSKSEISEA